MFLKIIIILAVSFSKSTFGNKDVCNKFLRELANEQMELVYCVTTNSVPVTMCITCVEKYQNVLEAYDKVTSNCSSVYFDKDRINLVASVESVLTGLWTKAYCDDCFNNNNSIVFNDKFVEFDSCRSTHKDNPCEMCKTQYMNLNNFYINLDQHNNGEVCFDLQDSMNRTRTMWSKEWKCCGREYNMKLFTLALCIISCLPLLFYSTTYFITKRQERNNHILTDEGPLPSTSRRDNMNDFNNTTQSVFNNIPCSPSTSTANNITSPSSKISNKNGFNILNDEMDSSDDEMKFYSEKKIH